MPHWPPIPTPRVPALLAVALVAVALVWPSAARAECGDYARMDGSHAPAHPSCDRQHDPAPTPPAPPAESSPVGKSLIHSQRETPTPLVARRLRPADEAARPTSRPDPLLDPPRA